MRRLTNKDVNNRKNDEEEASPDFYQLTRENPLPDHCPADVPLTIPSLVPPAIAAAANMHVHQTSPTQNSNSANNEIATLDKRRVDILQSLNLATSQHQHQPQHQLAPPVNPLQDLLQRLLAQQQQGQAPPPPPPPPQLVTSALPNVASLLSLFSQAGATQPMSAPSPAPPQVPQPDPNALLIQLGIQAILAQQQQQQAPPPPPQQPAQNAQILQLMQSLGNSGSSSGSSSASQTPPQQPQATPVPQAPMSAPPDMTHLVGQSNNNNNSGATLPPPTSAPSMTPGMDPSMTQQLAVLLQQLQNNGGSQ